MERKKRTGCIILAAVICMALLQNETLAADAMPLEDMPQQTDELVLGRYVTRFLQAGEQIGEVDFQYGQPEAELTAQMPQTLDVLLADGTAAEIPVTWVSPGDYSNTDDFYYSFIPRIASEEYELADDLDPDVDVPYIMAERQADETTEPDIYISEQAGNQNASTIFSFLTKNCGFNSAAACGILANIECESGFNPNIWGDKDTSYGICQWHGPRLAAMQNWCSQNGYSWQTLTGQMYYLRQELSANNSAYLYNGLTIKNMMRGCANTSDGAYDAGYTWCYHYEVPADKNGVSSARGNKARSKYWPQFGHGSSGYSNSIFSDVWPSDWFYSAVQYVYNKKIMMGTDNGRFEPSTTMNRAMAATVLYAVSRSNSNKLGLGSKYSSRFKDVAYGQWYTQTVRWAAGSGIVYGYSYTEFAPSDPVTREQFVTMLYTYAKKLGKSVSANMSLYRYSDRYAISSYAERAVQWAGERNIVSSSGMLRPTDALTRAEAATMIQKFIQAVS